jgi:translation initiation factor 2 alpha subunit (eIF-2alpha)
MKYMFWYSKTIPDVHEYVLARIISLDDIGFNVALEEYNDLPALLIISDVLKKKTRKNLANICPIDSSQILVVTNIEKGRDDNVIIDVSMKDVEETDRNRIATYMANSQRIIGISRRLSYMTEYTQSDWMTNAFSALLDKDSETHLLDTLSLREHIDDLEIPDAYREALHKHHKRLFGINLVKTSKKVKLVMFTVDGCAQVRERLSRLVSSDLDDEALYDGDGVNIEIRPIAIPVYEVVVTAGTTRVATTKCDEIVSDIIDFGKKYGFAEVCQSI